MLAHCVGGSSVFVIPASVVVAFVVVHRELLMHGVCVCCQKQSWMLFTVLVV